MTGGSPCSCDQRVSACATGLCTAAKPPPPPLPPTLRTQPCSLAGGAPITKGLLLGTLASSVLVQAKVARRRAPLLVRALTNALAFRAPGELLFGAALLYFYRVFERQWGSAKYGSFVTVVCGLAYALEAAAAAVLEARWGAGAAAAAAGPFPLIFANLAANFVLLVPPMHHFTVFGIKMTDKVSSGEEGWGSG